MYTTNQRILAGLGRHRRGVRGLRGLGQGLPAGTTTTQATTAFNSVSGANVGGAVGTLLSKLFSGAHYTGPTVQAGFVTWAQSASGLAILQQIAATGVGPPWPGNTTETSSTLTYGGSIAPGSGGLPANVPPTTMTTQQFAGWLVQNAGVIATSPVTVAPSAVSSVTTALQSLLGTKPATPVVAAPTTGLTTASLLSNPLVLVGGGLVLVLLLSGKRSS